MYVTDSVVGFRPLDNVPSSSDDPLRRGRGYAVLHDSQDNLWVGTLGQGLWRVRRRGETDFAIERTIELTGLSSDGVLALMEDRDGNLWAGTSEGLNRLVPRRIIRVTDLGLVTGVEPGVDGDLWVEHRRRPDAVLGRQHGIADRPRPPPRLAAADDVREPRADCGR